MTSKFQSYAYNCRSLFNLKTSAAEIDGSVINLPNVRRSGLGKLTLVGQLNNTTEYENDQLEALYNDTAGLLRIGTNTAAVVAFFTAHFRPFGLFNELFRVMSNSAASKGYNIQNLDHVGDRTLKNKSDMRIQVAGETVFLTETVTIHKISDGSDTIESDTPLSVAKCRWVIEFSSGQPIVHLSDTTFVHNHARAEKAFDHRGIIERLRHFLKRLFTRTDAGIKPLININKKYRYSRIFKAPDVHDAAQNPSQGNSLGIPNLGARPCVRP